YTTTSITGSLLVGNTANIGGGIYEHGGEVTLVNSTISGSTGPAISVGQSGPELSSTLRLRNVTITRNTGYVSGGLDINGNQPVTLRNTLLADNQATSTFAPDIAGTITSEGYNL